MKVVFPEPIHESYRRHRRQRTSQIILPIVLVVILFLALVVFVNIATFGNNGDAGRWAAIATMWIAMPVCAMGLAFLLIIGGLVYLLGRLLGVAPRYTNEAQNFFHKLAIRIRRVADMAVKPIFAVNEFGATIKALLGRK